MANKEQIISVLVITYNHENFIKDCLESILCQKVDATIEILIGDDASTDNTPQILLNYYKKYPNIIKLILRRKNIGAAANIVDLLKKAKGDYIAFCEGDDFWISTDKLSMQLKFFQKSSYVGVVHNVLLVDENKIKLLIQKLNWVRKKKFYSISTYDPYKLPEHISSLMFKNFKKLNNLSIDMLICNKQTFDKMLYLIVLSQGNIGRLDEVLSAYRFMRSHLSNSIVAKMNNLRQTNTLSEMLIYLTMEKWLKNQFGISKKFVSAKSRLIITALFHKLKGYDISLFELFKLCNHRLLVVLYLPIAFVKQSIDKISVSLKYSLR